jgi:hypothetical protein|tara:strand:+ start:285 stop:479 length:195 start_codon:yes stop_codon:yes gene_type:complete
MVAKVNDSGVPGISNFDVSVSHHFVNVYLKLPWKQSVLLSRNIRELLVCDVPTADTGSLVVFGV